MEIDYYGITEFYLKTHKEKVKKSIENEFSVQLSNDVELKTPKLEFAVIYLYSYIIDGLSHEEISEKLTYLFKILSYYDNMKVKLNPELNHYESMYNFANQRNIFFKNNIYKGPEIEDDYFYPDVDDIYYFFEDFYYIFYKIGEEKFLNLHYLYPGLDIENWEFYYLYEYDYYNIEENINTTEHLYFFLYLIEDPMFLLFDSEFRKGPEIRLKLIRKVIDKFTIEHPKTAPENILPELQNIVQQHIALISKIVSESVDYKYDYDLVVALSKREINVLVFDSNTLYYIQWAKDEIARSDKMYLDSYNLDHYDWLSNDDFYNDSDLYTYSSMEMTASEQVNFEERILESFYDITLNENPINWSYFNKFKDKFKIYLLELDLLAQIENNIPIETKLFNLNTSTDKSIFSTQLQYKYRDLKLYKVAFTKKFIAKTIVFLYPERADLEIALCLFFNFDECPQREKFENKEPDNIETLENKRAKIDIQFLIDDGIGKKYDLNQPEPELAEWKKNIPIENSDDFSIPFKDNLESWNIVRQQDDDYILSMEVEKKFDKYVIMKDKENPFILSDGTILYQSFKFQTYKYLLHLYIPLLPEFPLLNYKYCLIYTFVINQKSFLKNYVNSFAYPKLNLPKTNIKGWQFITSEDIKAIQYFYNLNGNNFNYPTFFASTSYSRTVINPKGNSSITAQNQNYPRITKHQRIYGYSYQGTQENSRFPYYHSLVDLVLSVGHIPDMCRDIEYYETAENGNVDFEEYYEIEFSVAKDNCLKNRFWLLYKRLQQEILNLTYPEIWETIDPTLLEFEFEDAKIEPLQNSESHHKAVDSFFNFYWEDNPKQVFNSVVENSSMFILIDKWEVETQEFIKDNFEITISNLDKSRCDYLGIMIGAEFEINDSKMILDKMITFSTPFLGELENYLDIEFEINDSKILLDYFIVLSAPAYEQTNTNLENQDSKFIIDNFSIQGEINDKS